MDKAQELPQQEAQEVDYVGEIERLKERTVDKDKYNKVVEENRKLLSALVNGEQLQQPSEQDSRSIQQMRQELFGGKEYSNIEYCKRILELRDAIIENGSPDPFLPIGHKIFPTSDDITQAEELADIMRNAIEYADGDSQLFTSEFNRHFVDIKLPKRR